MDNNIDFKDLWQQQPVSEPGIQDLYTKMAAFKRAGLRKLLISNILLIATCFFIAYVSYNYKSQLITTQIGTILTIVAVAIFLFAYNKLYTLFHKIDDQQSNTAYLQNLRSIKTKQQFLHTTMLSLYYIMLSAGVGLYMYEPSHAMGTSHAIFAYTATAAWILFSWFYIRPRTIKKQETKVNELIDKLQLIQNQLAD